MHIIALMIGAWLNVVGDIGVCSVAVATVFGLTDNPDNKWLIFRSRGDMAFQLFPAPLLVAIVGLILAQWGWFGL
jgi:hypothetical protein